MFLKNWKLVTTARGLNCCLFLSAEAEWECPCCYYRFGSKTPEHFLICGSEFLQEQLLAELSAPRECLNCGSVSGLPKLILPAFRLELKEKIAAALAESRRFPLELFP